MLHTLVPDLNIAPLKYRFVHTDHGGPIAKISCREITLLSHTSFEAFAYLDEQKTGCHKEGQWLYGDAHGTGTAATQPEAIFRAISEALERWAWNAAYQDPALRQALRYDLDPSTTGFAAYPGLGRQGARKRAFFEAAERWSLREWWEGRLAHRPLPLADSFAGSNAIQLLTGIPGVAVALLWHNQEGLTHYGFAAAHSPSAAAEKAAVELQRNQSILIYYHTEKAKAPLPELNRTERRLCFFAEAAGQAIFQARVNRQGAGRASPTLLVDQPVQGPWSEYTHVWRCLFDGRHFYETDSADYFLF